MIKVIKIFTVLCFFAVSVCNGQHLIGINTCFTENKISCDSFGFNKKMYSEPGYGFGIAYKHMELRNIIGFQCEVNYNYSGFRIEPSDSTYFKQRLKFVHIPFLAHVDFGQHAVKFIFAIGPYVDIMVGKSKFETNIQEFDSSGVDRIAFGKYTTFSYGLAGQAGFAICTNAGVFQITAQGIVGMSKLIKMPDIALLNYVRRWSAGIGISYYKPFGKEPYFTKKEKIKEAKDKS